VEAHHSDRQTDLFGSEENRAYLTEQLITYIGNKRALLDFVGPAVDKVKGKLGKERIMALDLFSGSGIVARYLKRHSELLIANDLEDYCEVINSCYLANPSTLDIPSLRETHRKILHRLKTEPLREGIIARNYAPKDDNSIAPGERVFYTNRNARYLDTAHELIAELPNSAQPFYLGPLLSGVFKGFYKNTDTGIGHFGGTNGDALFRIKGDIVLPFPVFSAFECQVKVYKKDANALVRQLCHVDFAYLDPPYNQHPYGSNYFMLNLLVNYQEPQHLSKVSGIPTDWKRSDYNKKQKAFQAFSDIVKHLDAQFMLVSFNSEGFIRKDDMLQLLSTVGHVELLETKYNAFRGSRNLRNRDIHVKEYLFLVERYE
jgi:adenine-specific DNA-methyltransferase